MVTIYEGMTLLFIGVGILILIIGFFYDRTKKSVINDDSALEDEVFRKQVNLINEKIYELNDYHTFVQEEIEKKHKELLFLYQMMAEKEKTIRQIQIELEQMKHVNSVKTATSDVSSEQQLEEKVINSNKRIIELKNNGYNEKEIAKVLDIGQGQVRLVLNLFE